MPPASLSAIAAPGWSRLDNTFEGVPVQFLLERAGVKPAAQYCLVFAEQGFTTNLPLSHLDRPDNLIALKWGGDWLTPEHGWPARLLVPHLYFWKSAKWVRGFTLLDADVPGFWEQNGYHMRGDPWTEERYGGRGVTKNEINPLRKMRKKDGEGALNTNKSEKRRDTRIPAHRRFRFTV